MSSVEGFKNLMTAAVMILEARSKGLSRVEYSMLSLWQGQKGINATIAKLVMTMAPANSGSAGALEEFIRGRGGKSPLPRTRS